MTEKRFPYMKWYARDWRGDGALRGCSFAARGLWADILTIMHDEGDPYGHLRINGTDPDASKLGRMLGGTAREIEKLLSELCAAGVFSRTAAGTIFSRRMVRDRAKAEADKKNGKGGGNPKLKDKDNGGVNPPDKAHIPLPEPVPVGKKEITPATAGLDGFEDFWKAYRAPPNSKKNEARKAWLATTKARPPLPELLRAAANYQTWLDAEWRKNKREYPAKQHPSGWLRGEVWGGFLDTGPAMSPEERAAAQDRRDRLMQQGKYDPMLARQ